MNKIKITIILCVTTVILFLAARDTKFKQEETRFEEGYKIYPAPIPTSLSFANEEVPLSKYQVKERLDRELQVNTFWQSSTLLILKRSKKYFHIIEPILAEYGVPDDFKYLAVAESGLQNVISSAGAKGVWQFMSSSGKSYGLEITSEVDERYHLKRSTEAACIYLKEAYGRFGSWTLAAAAYNRGMSGINRDLQKQLVTGYYDLHLNTETSRYILRILALKTIIENPSSYGFYLEEEDYYPTTQLNTVFVDASILNLAEYAISLGTNYHVLKSLNPWIKGNELTVKERPYTLLVPRS